MTLATETRAVRTVVYAVLLIPLIAGTVAAYGGLEGFAALFHESRTVVLAPALRDHVRAITWMFALLAPLVWWTVQDLAARATPFRLIMGWAAAAGIVRIVGMIVDGYAGVLACIFTGMELVLLPILIVWHARLVRRTLAAAA